MVMHICHPSRYGMRQADVKLMASLSHIVRPMEREEKRFGGRGGSTHK